MNNISQCDLYSNWIAKEIATSDEIFASPDFSQMFARIKPSWANRNVTELLQRQVDDYLINAFSEVGYRSEIESRISWSTSVRRKLIEDLAIGGAKQYFDTKLKFGNF